MTTDPQVLRMDKFRQDNVMIILRSQVFSVFLLVFGISLYDISPLAIFYDAVSLHHPPKEGWKP